MNYQTVILSGVEELKEAHSHITEHIPATKTLQKTNIFTVSQKDEKKSIGIKEIHSVLEVNALKSAEIRMIAIEKAHTLTTEAQNSILKTIEESANNTIIVFLAQNSKKLLDTIRSRSRIINVKSEKDQDSLVKEYIEASDILSREKIIKKVQKSEEGRNITRYIIEKLIEVKIKEERTTHDKDVFAMIELLKESRKAVENNVSPKQILETISIHLL